MVEEDGENEERRMVIDYQVYVSGAVLPPLYS